jgi:NAD dependent epimerase/dehydratase family enzyme
MALPVRLFVGGRLGSGRQAVPWIHMADVVGSIGFLLRSDALGGPFNLIAPEQASGSTFYRCLARVLHRPYWLPTPSWALRLALGEMSVLVLEGRQARPSRLLEAGYRFRFGELEPALRDLLGG